MTKFTKDSKVPKAKTSSWAEDYAKAVNKAQMSKGQSEKEGNSKAPLDKNARLLWAVLIAIFALCAYLDHRIQVKWMNEG